MKSDGDGQNPTLVAAMWALGCGVAQADPKAGQDKRACRYSPMRPIRPGNPKSI